MPLLDQINLLKQLGLTGFGIVASFLCHQVQPLKVREHYGFEYIGAEDTSRMVVALELTDEEVLARLRKVLKGVSVVPPRIDEYDAAHPPLSVSSSLTFTPFIFLSYKVLFTKFLFLCI